MIVLVIAIAFIGSAILSVLTLHPGAEWMVRCLGEENCLETEAVNGCNPWMFSTLFSTALAGMLWSSWQWWALCFVLAGPVVSVVVVSLMLRFGEWGARQREFVVRGGKVYSRYGTAELHPVFVRDNPAYYCTGPASGYCLYSLVLHNDDGTVYCNSYVSREEKDRHLEALTQTYHCASLDLVFGWEDSPGVWCCVILGQDWLPVLAGELASLSPSGREWWKRWLQPAFGRLGSVTIKRDEVRANLEEIESAYRELVDSTPRIAQDCKALRNLLEKAGSEISLMTTKKHLLLTEKRRENGYVRHTCDNGLWTSEVEERS